LSNINENESTIKTHSISVPNFGQIKVHVQGELDDKKAVFLTVHDIGSNHSSWRDFVENSCMQEIRARSVFIHVDIVGQEDNAEDLDESFQFPTIQQLGEDMLIHVLDYLKVSLVVGIGEGAGANILVRFGLKHPQRCLGLVLIHLVSSGVGFLETLKERFLSKRRTSDAKALNPLEIVKIHRLGDQQNSNLLENYSQRVQTINARNLRRFVDAYMNRKELQGLTSLDVLFICGARSPYASGVLSIHSKSDKTKTSLLKVDGVVDVLSECPEKLAQSLLLFVKGLGFLTSLQLPGVALEGVGSGGSGAAAGKVQLGAIGRRRTLSMEEYDLPRARRLSLTK